VVGLSVGVMIMLKFILQKQDDGCGGRGAGIFNETRKYFNVRVLRSNNAAFV